MCSGSPALPALRLHTGAPGLTLTLALALALTLTLPLPLPLTTQEHPYDSEQDAIHRRTKLL